MSIHRNRQKSSCTKCHAALDLAFGQPYGGEVVAIDDSVGYRVYKKTARKIKPDLF